MTNNEAAKWIQLYIDLAKLDQFTDEATYLNDDNKKTIEAMEMAINELTAQSKERTKTHTCDLIDRRALIKEFSDFVRASNNSDFAPRPTWNDAVSLVKSMPLVQPSSSCAHENDQDLQSTCNKLATDCISRQATIREYQEVCKGIKCGECPFLIKVNTEKGSHLITDCKLEAFLHDLPSVQPEINTDGDTISRQVAIDAVEESRRLNHHQDGKAALAHEHEHRHFLKILMELPSAQPEPCEDAAKSEDKKKLSWLGKRCEDCGNKKCKELGELPKGYDCALWQAERRTGETN